LIGRGRNDIRSVDLQQPMSDSVLSAHYAPAVRERPAWRLFLLAAAAATLLPLALVPWAHRLAPDSESALRLLVVLNFIGANFHVATTGWFYTDAEMRPHFRAHPWRYLIVPVALIAGSALAFEFVPAPLRGWLLLGFLSWQLWHYQKQNVGLLSFVAAGTGSGPLSVWERRTLMLSAVAAILGFFSLNPIGLPGLSTEFAWAHRLGGLVYLLSPIALAITLVKVPALRRSPLRLCFLIIGAAFFLPTYLFDNATSATLGYAIAHGLQYLVFMGVVALKRRPLVSLAVMAAIGAAGAVLLNAGIMAPDAGLPWGNALYGAFVGTVMAHFVLDAGIWRLREPFQRKYVRERFAFVFSR
jgi:hypothetical protein